MKKPFSTLLLVALVLTVIGFLVDGDAKEPSMLMRFVEFAAMTAILFMLVTGTYFLFRFTKRKLVRIAGN